MINISSGLVLISLIVIKILQLKEEFIKGYNAHAVGNIPCNGPNKVATDCTMSTAARTSPACSGGTVAVAVVLIADAAEPVNPISPDAT
jgi:hypothetical protein